MSAFIELPRHDPEHLRVMIDGARHYTGGSIGPTAFASVTTVLSATSGIESSFAYQAWRRKHEAIEPGLADLARDVAADRGTKLHAEVTESLVSRVMPTGGDVWLQSMTPILRQWMAVARVALADGCVWHSMDRIAGTVDFVLWIAGGYWLVDLKSAMRPWDHARVRLALAQLGGYAECLRWTFDVELAGLGFVVALPDAPAQVRLSGPRSFSIEDAVTAWHERRQQYREQRQA